MNLFCPSCGKEFVNIPIEWKGKKVKCEACKHIFVATHNEREVNSQSPEPYPGSSGIQNNNSVPELRKYEILDIFAVGAQVAFNNFKPLLSLFAIGIIPIALLRLSISIVLPGSYIGTIISFVQNFIIGPLVMGAGIWMVSDIFIGKELSISKAYAESFSMLFDLAFGNLSYLIAVAVGIFLAFLVPGSAGNTPFIIITVILILLFLTVNVYLMMSFMLCPQSIILEGKSVLKALIRSFKLVKGYWLKVFYVALFTGAFFFIYVRFVFFISALSFSYFDQSVHWIVGHITMFVCNILCIPFLPFLSILPIPTIKWNFPLHNEVVPYKSGGIGKKSKTHRNLVGNSY